MAQYVIVSRYNDPDRGLTVSSTKGPFTDRRQAEVYNAGAYLSPELNLIVPLHEPYSVFN